MAVEQRIAQRRRELDLNQTELAHRAGLKPSAISQYESGERRPSYEALIKLASALQVSTDYLIGSDVFSDMNLTDPAVRTVAKMMDCLPEDKKRIMQDFAFFLQNYDFSQKYPVLGDPTEYAEFLLRDTFQDTLPVDVYAIAEKLNIKIIEASNLGYEGAFFKVLGGGTIILDQKIQNLHRRRFTIAHLLGHSYIPWHAKSSYYCREYGTSTLKTEDTLEMEANNFAESLLMPKFQLEKDILSKHLTIEELGNYANEKYQVSLFALTNSLIHYAGSKHALVNSKNNNIEKTFQGARPVVGDLNPGTIAASFFNDPPAEKTTRNGFVPASFWFLDASPNEEVYEESMYNPEYEAVLTLLTL